jgi:hypothetical protein
LTTAGKSPLEVFERDRPEPRFATERELSDALTIRVRRRVRTDGTLSVGGAVWELVQGFLAGKNVTVARTLLEPTTAPWVEHEEQRLVLRRVDARANATQKRAARPERGIDAVPFDPAAALLDEATGRAPYHREDDEGDR